MRVNSILIIDDDHTSNFVSCDVINRISYSKKIEIRTTGNDALEYLRNSCLPTNTFPDLIFVDLKMPGIDGFDFLQNFEQICADIRHEIAVVILTESRNADDIVKLRNTGNYFLVNKPLTVDKIFDIHHRYFRSKHHYNSI